MIDDELVYLDGNSLGRLPRATAERLARTVAEEWGGRLIRGWDEGWMELPLTIGDRLGEVALGAAPGPGRRSATRPRSASTSSPRAALDLRPGRDQIVTDYDNFPTDRYVLEGLAQARGLELVFLRGDPAGRPEPEAVAEAVGERTALVTFSHVSYRSAHIADMAQISRLAHDAGALVAVGSQPHRRVGPGRARRRRRGPGRRLHLQVPQRRSRRARVPVRARAALQPQLRQPIWGWLGRRDPFEMAHGYVPAAGIRALLSGTPPVLALSAVDEGVRLVAEAGIDADPRQGGGADRVRDRAGRRAPGRGRRDGRLAARPGAPRRPRRARPSRRQAPVRGADRAWRDPGLPAART